MTTAIDCALSLTCAGKTVARYLTATMFFWMNLVNGVSDGGSRRASGSSDGVIGASERQTSRVNRVTASMKKRPALEHRIWMAASATGWSDSVSGRELRPLKSSGFHGALLQQPSSVLR